MKLSDQVIRWILRILLIAFCFLLQTVVFNYLELAGLVPNLIIAYVSLTGFMKGRKTGMITGFISGMIIDFFSGQFFGAYTLMYLVIGFLNGLFRKWFYGDDIKLPMLFVGISDILSGIFIYLAAFLPRGRNDFPFYLNSVIIPEAVYTAVISLLLFLMVRGIDLKLIKRERKRERRLG